MTSLSRVSLRDGMLTLTLLMGLLPNGGLCAQERPADLTAFRSMVREQEAAVGFVRGEGVATQTTSGPDGIARAGEEVARFLFEVKPHGRFRIDYDPTVMRWLVNPADAASVRFTENKISRGFDGKVSWSWERGFMLEGKPETFREPRRASVQAGYDPTLAICGAALFGYTLPGFYARRGWSFAESLEIAEAPFALQWNEQDKMLVLSLPSENGKQIETWFLAERWAYCLARYEKREVATGRSLVHVEVQDAIQLHELFWYPTHVRVQLANAGYDSITENAVGTISVAEPDPREFEPRFPAGTYVTDLLTGEQVQIAAPDHALTADLARQGDELRQMVLYEPRPSWLWLKVAGAALAAIVGLLLLRRNKTRLARRRKPTRAGQSMIVLPMFLALHYVGAGPCRAQEPWVLQKLPEAHVDNCGVNAVGVVAAFFGRMPALPDLARDLGCGERRAEAVALADVEAACRKIGLETQAFQQSTLSAVVKEAGLRRGVAIVMVATDGAVAHYLVVAPSREGVAIVNPAASVRSCDWFEPYALQMASRFTGIGVIVWRGDDRSVRDLADGASLRLPLVEIAGKGVHVRNTTAGPIRLRGFRASCGCITGASLSPEQVAVGAIGTLRVHFDSAQLSRTGGHQSVVLDFEHDASGSARPAAQVALDVAYGGVPERPVAKAGITPSLVEPDAVPANDAGSGAVTALVSVLVPAGGVVTGWRASNEAESELQAVEPVTGGVLCHYRVRWNGRPGIAQATVRDARGAVSNVTARLLAARGAIPEQR